jgi:hypothetical protein
MPIPMPMLIPSVLFWVLVFLGRDELGLKRRLFAVGTWAALFLGFVVFRASPYLFIAVQALMDVVLIIVIFGGDIRIR